MGSQQSRPRSTRGVPCGPARNVKPAGVIVLLLLAAAVGTAAAFARSQTPPNASRCGGLTWRMKTFSDAARKAVTLAPKSTTVGDIGQRANPRLIPTKRRTPFQKQNWEVVGAVTLFKLEDAGLRLILFDHGAYLNAVIQIGRASCREGREVEE